MWPRRQGQIETGEVARSPAKDLTEVQHGGSWNCSAGAHGRHRPWAESMRKGGFLPRVRSRGKALEAKVGQTEAGSRAGELSNGRSLGVSEFES